MKHRRNSLLAAIAGSAEAGCGRRRVTFGVCAARDAALRLLRALDAALARRGVSCKVDAAGYTLLGLLDVSLGVRVNGDSSPGPSSLAAQPQPRSAGRPSGYQDPNPEPGPGPPAKRQQLAAGQGAGCWRGSLRVAVLQEAPGVFVVTASVPADCPDVAAWHFAMLVGDIKVDLGQAGGGWTVKC